MLADLPPPDHDPAEAREAADEILSRPEYQWGGEGDSPLESAVRWVGDRLETVAEWIGDRLEPVAEWLSDRLGGLAGSLGIGGGSLPLWVGWLVLAVLIGAILVMVVLVARRSWPGWRRDRSADAAGRSVVVEEDDTVDWRAEVARCEAAGLWAEALRARYRVLVGELARRELVGDLVGRTAGELVDALRKASPAAAPAFVRATELFERAWYGGADVGPADRDRFVESADAALAAAASEPSRREVAA